MRLDDLKPASNRRERLEDSHFQKAYDLVKNEELHKNEIKELAHSIGQTDEYDRTKGSAEMLLARMHILVHGLAPEGETQKRAEEILTISQSMIDFANRMGLDTVYNIDAAREELKNRPVRVKEEAALRMMSDFYMKNKASLPKDIAKHREEIVDAIMNGEPVEQVFAQYM